MSFWLITNLILLVSANAVDSCGLSDERPSWSLAVQAVRSPRPSRAVSLTERSGCGGIGDDLRTDDVTRANVSAPRVDLLLQLMKNEDVDAYIVTSSDEHLSEYVSENDARRAYLSGFTGSAGTAVVLAGGQRALWTDGRYFLQADLQLDCSWLLMKEGNDGVPTILEWLQESLEPNSTVGANPKLISAMEWVEYSEALKGSGIKLVGVETDLVDQIWSREGKEVKPVTPIDVLEIEFAGKRWEEKLADVRKEMEKEGGDMLVLSSLDEIAWLFNLRGGDIPNNPVFRSYAIIDREKIRLFIDQKIRPEIDFHLHVNQCDQECVEILNYRTIVKSLNALSSLDKIRKVMLPSKYSYSGGVSYAIYNSVPEEKRLSIISPVLRMKARKNAIESQGMKNAHRKDAVALIDFLSFLEDEIKAGRRWTEISAATKLEEFRAQQEHFQSLSFETISAFGSNGAIIHYKPTPETDKQITNESLYLLDSGGQYKDGTTDVTRTLHYGTPTPFQIEAYTRVLKGAIDVATVAFPKGTMDTRIDILARRALYEVGLDYKHGTGHGIGMFLFIHEAPTQMRIYGKEEHEMELAQFFSDEPGYYKTGDFGIRLESILTVVRRPAKYDDFPMLGFEPVTLVPFEPKLIDLSLLDMRQCIFLNMYHEQIRHVIGPLLDQEGRSRAKAYMMQRTEPLGCENAGVRDSTGALQREQVMRKHFESQQESKNGETPSSGGSRESLLNHMLVITVISCYVMSR